MLNAFSPLIPLTSSSQKLGPGEDNDSLYVTVNTILGG